MTTSTVRPRLRGMIHYYAFFVSLLSGTLLLLSAPTAQAQFGAGVYAASLSALLGVSALYHRVTWSAPTRRWVGRLDHSMICVLIAGTYTPFGLAALSETSSATLLSVIWFAAFAGISLHLLWFDAPKWLSAVVYVAIGWLGAVAMPEMVGRVGWTPTMLLLAGGILYSLGALVYALRRPDPVPHVFGYHEVFHSLVVVAALAHYVAVAMTLHTLG